MSTRLARGGRLIDRTKPITVSFNGRRMAAYQGDTLASAVLANDQMMVGRLALILAIRSAGGAEVWAG